MVELFITGQADICYGAGPPVRIMTGMATMTTAGAAPAVSRTLTDWWRAALPGDRAVSVAGMAVAALYTWMAVETPTGVSVAQAVISGFFLPFLWIWRARPVASAVGFTACLAAWSATWFAALPVNSGVTPWLLTAPMAVWGTSRYCADRRIPRAVLALMLVATFISPAMWSLGDEMVLRYAAPWEAVIVAAVHWLLLGIFYVAGARSYSDVLRRRAEDAQRLGRLRTAQEEEKLLIARELHDVLAHSLTMMKVQANAGIVASTSEPDAAVQALETIRETSDAALAEVRGMVRALRSSDSAELAPAHGVADIPEILAGFRAAGLDIEAELPGEVPTLPAMMELAVVRILTEALTNVVRHQGGGAHATVTVTCDDGVGDADGSVPGIAIGVVSQGPAQSHPQTTAPDTQTSPDSGAGLVGLSERVRSLGGTFRAGGSSECFNVHAHLPVRSYP